MQKLVPREAETIHQRLILERLQQADTRKQTTTTERPTTIELAPIITLRPHSERPTQKPKVVATKPAIAETKPIQKPVISKEKSQSPPTILRPRAIERPIISLEITEEGADFLESMTDPAQLDIPEADAPPDFIQTVSLEDGQSLTVPEFKDEYADEAEVLASDIVAVLPFLEFESPAEQIDRVNVEAPNQPTASEQLEVFIQTLEPEKAEEATAILEVIVKKAEQLQNLIEEVEGVESEIIEQELKVLCTRLLVCMGVEPSPKNVKRLLRRLTEEIEQKANAQLEVQDSGTHERKNGVTQLMDGLTELVHPMSRLLGQYAISTLVYN